MDRNRCAQNMWWLEVGGANVSYTFYLIFKHVDFKFEIWQVVHIRVFDFVLFVSTSNAWVGAAQAERYARTQTEQCFFLEQVLHPDKSPTQAHEKRSDHTNGVDLQRSWDVF